MPVISYKIASTLKDLDHAGRVRWLVFREEEKLLSSTLFSTGRELDCFDTLKSTLHLIVYVDDEPVAVARLLGKNPAVARVNRCHLGVPLEAQCHIVSGLGPGTQVAEVSRLAIRMKWRGNPLVFQTLRGGLYAASRRRGDTHWLGVSNAHTDSLEDALHVYQEASRRKLISSTWRLEPKALGAPATPPRRPWYSPSQRQRALSEENVRLPLPPTLSLVTKRVRAQVAGGPIYEPDFNSYALPIVVDLLVIEPFILPFPEPPLDAPQSACPHNHPVVP